MILANVRAVRDFFISLFVVVFVLLFHYESVRFFYLNPFFKKDLPKTKFLFPPAGWIMFFAVDDDYGCVEVFGVKDKKLQVIDPHDILRTRTIGFDNIHRNVLSTVGSPSMAKSFCPFLERRFPYFDRFLVVAVYYPSLTKEPYQRLQQVQYQCIARKEH